MQQEWVLNIKRQCEEQCSAFFFKQWGGWGVDGKKRAKKQNGRLLQGRTWDEVPVSIDTQPMFYGLTLPVREVAVDVCLRFCKECSSGTYRFPYGVNMTERNSERHNYAGVIPGPLRVNGGGTSGVIQGPLTLHGKAGKGAIQAPLKISTGASILKISGKIVEGGPLSSATIIAVNEAAAKTPSQWRRYIAYSDKVKVGGSLAWRANNPGNLRDASTKIGTVPGAVGNFAVFASLEDGRAAQRRPLCF